MAMHFHYKLYEAREHFCLRGGAASTCRYAQHAGQRNIHAPSRLLDIAGADADALERTTKLTSW